MHLHLHSSFHCNGRITGSHLLLLPPEEMEWKNRYSSSFLPGRNGSTRQEGQVCGRRVGGALPPGKGEGERYVGRMHRWEWRTNKRGTEKAWEIENGRCAWECYPGHLPNVSLIVNENNNGENFFPPSSKHQRNNTTAGISRQKLVVCKLCVGIRGNSSRNKAMEGQM